MFRYRIRLNEGAKVQESAKTAEGWSVPTPTLSQRLIVALDVSDRSSALRLVEQLNDLDVSFKIGSQLFTAEGPGLVREIASSASPVFLDLKFHDIPNTVAGAVASAANLGVAIINIHGLGGSEMMQAARRAVNEALGRHTIPGGTLKARPAVIAVTVLTSMSVEGLSEVGVGEGVESEVIRLARLARTSGLDGVVASAREISAIRDEVAASNFLIVTPGVRPEGSSVGDQKRVGTPAQAIGDGADYIVVGRPITGSPDPRNAAQRILEEVGRAIK